MQSLLPNISKADFTYVVIQILIMLFRADKLDIDHAQSILEAEFPKQMVRKRRRRVSKLKRSGKRTRTPQYNPDDMLTPDKAAKVLSLSVKTLANMRSAGGGPVFLKLANRTIRYRYSDLQVFIANSVRRNTSQY
ncbi:helix-turn-helix protein [Maritalea mobilis]|uniref:Helix-turn-helix protein n=1 Tax=Maritalea mobilis TaxID=483324 RepID=A0A4R6VUU6_9HYPH|nr:helix-turn-helix domain-containing protein [Maritalea mobilis]TDQ67271.1 helix-turn-helix protein [Maritalea mobilis]